MDNAKRQKDQIPPIIFGTSGLGNLYEEVPFSTKLRIVKECIQHTKPLTVFDSAGKYGAGLALEALGKSLSELNVPPSEVKISNKLGWYQTPLKTQEPSFEPGVWKGLTHDAEQRISYQGILDCFHQGNKLLSPYKAEWVSVHDPDEYLDRANSKQEKEHLYNDILEAYRALQKLKEEGLVEAIGVGSKNWQVIKTISQDVPLDWVMVANSLTVHQHPEALLKFIESLNDKGVTVINSAIFNGGFLVGSDYYNYQLIDKESEFGKNLFQWRATFQEICKKHQILPAEACFNFGRQINGISSIALNTTKPKNVKRNVDMLNKTIKSSFWNELLEKGLISRKPNS